MLSKVSWPTALVLCVFLAGYVILIVLGKPVPAWMAGAAGILGSVLLGAMRSVGSGSGPSGPGGAS
jgi:hypothetical protein